MASNNPFYAGASSPSTAMPANGSTQRLALDNMIRRELKVSDPSDPNQIAQALLNRYRDDPRANAIAQEARGLPFLLATPAPAMVPQAATSTAVELQQAKDDVERDLQELATNTLLKDITPEIQGWAQAIRSAIQEGTAAARFALDPRQRDKAFAIRRQLGDYARIARLIGALTPTLNLTYRSFAESLDEVAAIILVTMGEALASVGFSGGRYLLQAPYSELQVRRDTVIYALRNLMGAAQEAYGPNEWPRGLDAYRKIFDALEAQGQGDLRALLVEGELSRVMDELLQRSAQGGASGLRALGATAQIDLEGFRRLIAIAGEVVSPRSPPLTAFLEALQLFVDAFVPSGGFRLMRIARPSILFYGLYGSDETPADRRLAELVLRRGFLANQLDCFLGCNCSDQNAVLCQIVLDKILYDVDRAIDLYALGSDELKPPEIRAAAYSYVIDAARSAHINCGTASPITETLDLINRNLRPPLVAGSSGDWKNSSTDAFYENPPNESVLFEIRNSMIQELDVQKAAEARWQNLVMTMAPNCIDRSQIFGRSGRLTTLINTSINLIVGFDQRFSPESDQFSPNIPRQYEDIMDNTGVLIRRSGDGA
jgi:hypothetical protein